MGNEPGITTTLEPKSLTEALRYIFVGLELTQDVDEDAAVEGWLTVHGRNDVGNLLEGQRSDLFHDLGRTLHVLPLKGHQRLFGVVKVDELGPPLGVIEKA